MAEAYEGTLACGLDEVRKDLKLLLGTEVTFPAPEIEWLDADASSPRAPLEIELITESEESGRIRLRIELGLGILMSGLLMMVSAPVIKDRLSSAQLEEGDADAIAEIGNQVAGSLNTGLTGARRGASFHIRRGDVWLTGKPGPALTAGPVLLARQACEIPGFPSGAITLTFDPAAARDALGAESSVATPSGEATPAVAPSPDGLAAPAPGSGPPAPATGEPSRTTSSLLLLYEVRAEGWESARFIQSCTGWPIVIQRLDGTARRRLLEGRISAVVVDTGERKERGLTACRRLVRLINGAGVPVFACAPAWTREDVQRAIRAGVSGILVKPLESERIVAALGEFATVA